MNNLYHKIILLTFTFFSTGTVSAQYLTENASDRTTMNAAADVYYKALGEEAGLYSGINYTGYGRVITEGHQYFVDTEKSTGSVFYNGMVYKQVSMWFDLIKDQLIVEHPNGFSKVVLHNDLVKQFMIHGHLFIKYEHDSTLASSPVTGFYDQLYTGKEEVMVRRSKSFIEKVDQEGIWMVVLKQKNDRFIKKDGEYFKITNAKSVLNVLGSHGREIQAHLKKNKIKFRRDPEKAIVLMVSYFDQING